MGHQKYSKEFKLEALELAKQTGGSEADLHPI